MEICAMVGLLNRPCYLKNGWYTIQKSDGNLAVKISGGFKSQQCQQLLTGPPYLRAPPNKAVKDKSGPT